MSSVFYWFWFCQSLTDRQWAREVNAPRCSATTTAASGLARWRPSCHASAIHLPRQLIIRRRTGNQARIRGMEDSASRKCPHPTQLNRTKHPRLMDGTMEVCYCCFLLERGRSCTVSYNYNTAIQSWWPVDAG